MRGILSLCFNVQNVKMCLPLLEPIKGSRILTCCWDMLDLGEALEDEVVVIEKLENPRKNKNSNIWIYIAQNSCIQCFANSGLFNTIFPFEKHKLIKLKIIMKDFEKQNCSKRKK